MDDIENSGVGTDNETPNQDNSPNTSSEVETAKAEAKEKRHLEQLKGAQQEIAVLKEVAKVRSENGAQYAIQLIQSNKDIASKVAISMGYANVQEMAAAAKKLINPDAVVVAESADVIVERKFVARIEREFYSKLTNEEADLVRAEYEDITFGKELTSEQAEKYLKKAQTLAIPNKKEPVKKYSTSSGSSGNATASKNPLVEDAIKYLSAKR